MHSYLMQQSDMLLPTLHCRRRSHNAVRQIMPRLRAACSTLISYERAGDLGSYLDVLRAAPVLDGRVFVELFARGRSPAIEDRLLARAAWHASAHINSCSVESHAVRCLLDTGALLLAGMFRSRRAHGVRAGALRLAAQLGSSSAERDDITAHAYQLMLAALRGAASCPANLGAKVKSCLSGQADGYGRFLQSVRTSRDAAARLLGLELLREFCRDKRSGQQAMLADEYYASAALGLPTAIPMRGAVSGRYMSVFHDDPAETRWNIRRGSARGFADACAHSAIADDSCSSVL